MPNKRISNRISVSSIDDGVTIHGGLRADKPLSQGYGDGNFLPDWSQAAKQPTIYLTLLNGNSPWQPSGEVSWYWNSTLLTFDSNGYSTNAKDSNNNPLFQQLSGNNRVLWEGIRVPSLKIVNNLAIAGSLNNDTIQVRGNIEMSGELVPFSSGVVIQLCELNANGYLGVINFVNGKSTLSSDEDSVTAWAELFSAGAVTGWDCEWYYNGVKVTSTDSNDAVYLSKHTGSTIYDQITVKGDDDNGGVIDVATLVCIFKMKDENNTWQQVATATETIDDVSDEEYMYVFFSVGSNQATQNDGSPVSLRRGQSVTWRILVAKESDADAYDATYKHFYFQPRNANGEIPSSKPIASLGDAAPSIGTGFYEMSTSNISGSTAKQATMTFTFDEVEAKKKNINGIIVATD